MRSLLPRQAQYAACPPLPPSPAPPQSLAQAEAGCIVKSNMYEYKDKATKRRMTLNMAQRDRPNQRRGSAYSAVAHQQRRRAIREARRGGGTANFHPLAPEPGEA